jgi:uncharacterized membrane protein YcaP (DUF421 family)
MEGILKVIFSSCASLISLFVLTKLMGNRQMSQLSMFDYVSSIALGSIAGEMAVMSNGSVLKPFIAMIVYSMIALFISLITCKSILLRRFFEGQAILLYQNRQIYEKNLLKARLDIDELLSVCRISGYYDLEEVHTIYMETNGEISVLPLALHRPATPSDFNQTPQQPLPMANVIIDGNIMPDNLKSTGKNEKWLKKQLENNQVNDIKEVILATYDNKTDKINVYLKFHRRMKRDIFE